MSEQNNSASNFANQVNATPDFTGQFEQQDIQANKVMGVLAYLSILVLIPLFGAKESKFARFHANQGLVLFIFEVIWWVVFGIVSAILGWIPVVGAIVGIIGWVVNLVFLIFTVIGEINVMQGKAKQLPLIGGITILK